MTDQPVQRSFFLRARDSRALYALVVALIIFVSLWMGSARKYLSTANPPTDVAKMRTIDVDYQMFYPGLEAKRTFAQTFNWYREPWRSDTWVAAYWRPLSMQAWWIQSHVFGEDRSYNWMRVSVALMVLFDLLLLAVFRAISNSRLLALVGLGVFALPASWLAAVSPLSEQPRVWNADLMITQGWKDQPDLWCNCLVLGAVLLAHRGRYGYALLCAAAAIGFKESGLLAFPLIAIVVGLTQGLPRIPTWFYFGALVVVALMMWGRWAAGPLVFTFHTYGRNVSGWTRYSHAMLPSGLRAVGSWGQLVFALGLFGLFVRRPRRPLVWGGGLLVAFLAAVILVSVQERLTWDVGFAQFITEGLWPSLLLFAWLAVVAILWRQREIFRWAVVLAICAYLAAAPFAMATQTADHVLALGRAFQAGYGACAVLALFWTAVEKFRRPPAAISVGEADPWSRVEVASPDDLVVS